MNETTLNVIIPSRARPSQLRFLELAIDSVKAQSNYSEHAVSVIVGVDKGQSHALGEIAERFGLKIAESPTPHGQAASLNAAIEKVDSDWVAFLEDDDRWYPDFLATAGSLLSAGVGFVSSTQLEIDEHSRILRINDFPTMSGWVMPASVLNHVGPFNEAYRFHLDNEWLGRLAETNVRRCHLVEMTAPLAPHLVRQVRPWLFNVLSCGGPGSELVRHGSPLPLIRRLVHSHSGMTQIAADPVLGKTSIDEQATLRSRFGRLPW
ncbi:glycosyltransferase family 2 protein [Paraburkholderia flagellata]|uniref:glycosyltransferase family 2 protein n=1 Tax=Paraburkholderia flagellata TaxID=2883241 RepID=UPI001F46AAE0|nr:glycosyltransferase [Paraburkholderia flagellata]